MKFIRETFLSVGAIALCLGTLEGGLQVHQARQRAKERALYQGGGPPLHVVVDSPVLYGLNPAHPEISAQGLRDDEVATPKPPNVWRILLLGDSIAYGMLVPREEAFPDRVERQLNAWSGPVEVVNSGVSGYTPYNQLQYYLAHGRAFDPDLVVVAFCMNDVANPRLHWGYTGDVIRNIPDAAIPNKEYDLAVQRQRSSLLKRAALYESLEWRMRALFARGAGGGAVGAGNVDGVPVYITGEDRLSIHVLLDAATPEWRWLTTTYAQLHDAVVADGAEFVAVMFPVAYQLDPDYPYLPQENLAQFFRGRAIEHIDLLPHFREHRAQGLFFENADGSVDSWHLSPRGHELTSELMSVALQRLRSPVPRLAKQDLDLRPGSLFERRRWTLDGTGADGRAKSAADAR